MQKLLLISSLFFCFLLSCKKQSLPQSHGYIKLRIIGSNDEFIWEQIDEEWVSKEGSAKLYGVTDQLSQFNLNIEDVRDTGYLPVVTINEIMYKDASYFAPDRVLKGYLRITDLDGYHISGEFEVELESSFYINERIIIAGKFGIAN